MAKTDKVVLAVVEEVGAAIFSVVVKIISMVNVVKHSGSGGNGSSTCGSSGSTRTNDNGISSAICSNGDNHSNRSISSSKNSQHNNSTISQNSRHDHCCSRYPAGVANFASESRRHICINDHLLFSIVLLHLDLPHTPTASLLSIASACQKSREEMKLTPKTAAVRSTVLHVQSADSP